MIGSEHLGTALLLAQPVEAFVCRDGGEPARGIVHVGDTVPADLEPRGLNSVVGVMNRAQQAVGDRAQVAAILLEAHRQRLFVGHRGHLSCAASVS